MGPSSRWEYGKFPEFGAIFMSNTMTRQECFIRSLFALPPNFAEFVRQVRAGMVLFLFDYQERKLYGVFEAVSDGRINIVPHAYTSSGKSFPAQVRFRIMWKCYPLREHEFRSAIRGNYYTMNKFNLGLSEDQVQRLLYLFDSRRVDIKKSPSEAKIKDSNSEHLGRKKIKRRHSDDLNNQKKIKDSNSEHLANTTSEMESCLVDSSALEKSPSSKSLKDIESGNISSSAPFELGDFIPLVSPEHCNPNEIIANDDLGSSGLYRAQSSPSCSEGEDFPKPHLRVKGLYSDRTEETNSVFARLEEREKCASVNRGNLLERRNIQSGMDNVPQRRKIPKRANVFSRLNFNSESNKQEKDAYKEKKKRRGRGGREEYYGRAEKSYLTIPPEMFDNRGEAVDNTERILFCRGMQGEQPFINAKQESKTDRMIEDKRYNHSPVSSFLSDMQQKKKKLVWPILRAESENVDVCESFLDDQVEACENSTVETKSTSLQLALNNIPFKVDAMKYLEHISEHNQDQQKWAEKDALLSFCASNMIDMVDDHKRCLENMATSITCLVEGHDNSDDKVKNDASLCFCASNLINMVDNHTRCLENMATAVTCLVEGHDNSDDKVKDMEDKLENLSNMYSVEEPHTVYKHHCLSVAHALRDPVMASDGEIQESLQGCQRDEWNQILLEETRSSTSGS